MGFRRAASRHRHASAIITMVAAMSLVLAGCADFSDQDRSANAGTFTSNPDVGGQLPPTQPTLPDQSEENGPPPTGPCVDPNPQVISTCLESTGGIHPANDQGSSVLVAERTTGKIFVSKRYSQRVIASVAVDGSGDGGLIDFALSPNYMQDQLIYALITTPSDNRVVRIAPGDAPKPVLTGIPKGATGNMGSLMLKSATELWVATGNGGSGSAASTPSSLAGKVLSINPLAPGTPKVIASGFGANVALCPDPTTGHVYVADSGGPDGSRLSEIQDGSPQNGKGIDLLWTWADRPVLGGCAISDGKAFVTVPAGKRIDGLVLPSRQSPSVGAPVQVPSNEFGASGRMTTTNSGSTMQVATINKSSAGAKPVATDDRVYIFFASSSLDTRS